MGLFRKSIKHSKSSKDLDNKIKNLDEDLKRAGIIAKEDDEIFCVEKAQETNNFKIIDGIDLVESKEDKLYNWRETIVEESTEHDEEDDKEVSEHRNITKVEYYISESNKELILLRDQVFEEISKETLLNLPEIKNKISKVLEIYEQIQEGLLNEPPETKNDDPLTPLNQNFITVDDLNKHYNLFINRIQEQIATIGGGGETKLQYLDDIVGIATNASAYDNKYLKYNHTIGKFEFSSIASSGSQDLNDTLLLGNTSSLGMSVGIITSTKVRVGGSTTFTEDLVVTGNARVTGILTIGTSSITLNGLDDTITIGNGVTITSSGNANYSGVITATSFVGDGSNLSGVITSIVGYATEGYVDAAVSGVSTFSGDYNDLTNKPSIPSIVGLASEGYVDAAVAAVSGVSTFSGGYWESSTSGIHTLSNVGIGTTNPTSALTVKGNTSLETLNVSGVSTFRGNVQTDGSNIKLGDGNEGTGNQIRLGNGSGLFDADLWIYHNSGYGNLLQDVTGEGVEVWTGEFKVANPGNPSETALYVSSGGGTELYHSTNKKFETIGAGVTVTGTTFTNQLSVSGISTFSGDGTNAYLRYGSSNAYTNFVTTYNVSQVGGVPLISADVNGAALSADTTLNGAYWRIRTLPTGAEVNGALNVSGVSTLNSNVSVGGTISVDGGVKLATNNATIVGTSGTAGEIKQIGGAPFYYDGSAWREFVLSSGTPVTVPADTEWDNVVFRATFDTDFTDAKFGATPVFVSAGSSIVGAAVTIGTGAYRNNGGVIAGIGVSYPYRSDYDFTGSWTIEFWIYHDSTPLTYETLVSQYSLVDTSGDWAFGVYNSGFNIFWYWDNENNTRQQLNSTSIAAFESNYKDKWVHYALVREGDNGSIHFYINGVESINTVNDAIIDNDILHINGSGLVFGSVLSDGNPVINGTGWNGFYSIDAIFDDVRISCGVGTAGQRYNSIGISSYATFTPPTTALPTTGTLSSYVQPPGDKYGEITLGGSPTWRGTSGVTVSQQSSGNYRVSFASSYTNANDYFVLTQAMDQGFASYVGVARSTTHVDLAINRQSNDAAVDTGALAVQIKNHI